MAFVTNQRWESRRGGTQTIDAIDGAPQAILDAWGLPIRKRWLGDFTGDKVTLANGRRFRVDANTLLRWEHVDGKALAADFPGLAEADGGFKETIQLDAPPAVARWQSQIETPPGVRFEYQPALTQEEIDEGASRPDWAVGSWAVFDAPGAKIAHLPRPVAVTADGQRHWFDLSINAQPPWGAILTVTGNLAWLEMLPASAWPVLVDPTFGYTSIGSTYQGSLYNNSVYGIHATPASSGDVDGIYFYKSTGSTISHTAGIFANSGGVPDAKIQDTDAINITSSAGAWWGPYTPDATASITGSTKYWVCETHTTGSWGGWYDSAADSGYYYHRSSGYSAGVVPSLIGNGALQSNHYTIYATYTEAGPTAAQIAAALQATCQLPRRPPRAAVPY